MAKYLILNCIVTLLMLSLMRLLKLKLKPARHSHIFLGILLVFTAVFDSLIIAAGIVGYNPESIIGVYIAKAPIEDFFYIIAAAVLIPSVWEYLGGKDG